MKKRKVVQIIEATIGGTRTHLRLLTTYLDRTKFDLTVICSDLREPSFKEDIVRMQQQGIMVFRVPMVRQVNLMKDVAALCKIYALLRQGKYDIVHSHSSKAGFLGRLAAYIIGIPIILYTPHAFAFHGYDKGFQRLFYLGIERVMAKLTTRLICVSESEKNSASEHRMMAPQNIVTNYNAIELPDAAKFQAQAIAMRTELGVGADKIIVGTVGYFRPQKDFGSFLKAAAMVSERFPDVVFIIVGDGEERPQIERMIRMLRLEPQVFLTGQVRDIYPYYALMDIFVLTSLWEGMPYAILEAMSMGKPVIATAVAGTRDIVQHEQTGLLAPAGDCQALAAAIISLITDKEKRTYLSQRALQLITKRHEIHTNILALEFLYQTQT